jgi:hypothetical protein|tara:strand:- start:2681 stop:3838 length:1158 start_codon:yes stop_codon:yes gene_type:complete
MKEVVINGGLRAKDDRTVALTLYSTPLARLMVDKNMEYLNVSYENKHFILKGGTQKKICIERKKEDCPLCVLHVGKIIDKELLKELKKDRKQRRMKVILKDIISSGELLEYNKIISYIEPDKNMSTIIPESDVINLACNISCIRLKKGFCYTFSIRNKILEEIALKKEKVMILRNGNGEFIIRKYGKGNTFNLYKSKSGYPKVYMPLPPSLIKNEENELFENGRRCFSSRALLSEKEFDLDISKYFVVKEERELAYSLMKQNVSIRIPQMGKREADIVLKDVGAQIEVTNIMPRKGQRHKNNAHGEGSHLNARLCEGFLRVTNKIVPYYFVVFNKAWMDYGWVEDTCDLIKPKVIPLVTNFKDNWAEDIAKKINLKIKQLKKNDN